MMHKEQVIKKILSSKFKNKRLQNFMIDGKNFFDQPIKNYKVTYIHFKNYYKMIAVDLSKQKALDADPKAIQQINFTENLE